MQNGAERMLGDVGRCLTQRGALEIFGNSSSLGSCSEFFKHKAFLPDQEKIDPRDPRDQAAMICYFTKEAFAIGFGVAGHCGLETQEIDACRL